ERAPHDEDGDCQRGGTQATTHVPPFWDPCSPVGPRLPESLTCPGWPCLGRVGSWGAEPPTCGPDSWHAGGGDPRAVLRGGRHPLHLRRGSAGTRRRPPP